MPAIKAGEFERMRNGGRISSVRVQPAGTAVTGYQVNLGNRPSLRDVGVVGAPTWTAEQTETWVRTSVSATCPRRLTVFEGGKRDIDRCMEFGDDFSGASIDTGKWTTSGTITVSEGIETGKIAGIPTFGGGYAFAARAKYFNAGAAEAYLFEVGDALTIGAYYAWRTLNSGGYKWAREMYVPSATDATGITSDGNYHKFEIIRNTASTATYVLDGVAQGSYTGGPSGAYRPMIHVAPVPWDWATVRKYVAAEPIAGTAQPSALNRSMCQSLNLADGLRACCA